MQVVKTAEDLAAALRRLRPEGRVGFTPTMGALHAGHLSLIAASKKACAVTVASIFVNPTQFNQAADLTTYPRTPGRDVRLLEGAGCDVAFLPEVETVYPPSLDTTLNLELGTLATVMEGEQRPGHFAGMAQVVNRLLDLVQPDALFMGQKDYQQAAIVAEMLRQTDHKVELVRCPIMREADGLAMSSRNLRLTPEWRMKAPQLNEMLRKLASQLNERAPNELETAGMTTLQSAGFRPEYVSIVHPRTLQSIEKFDAQTGAVICVAAWAADVRLIDNLLFEPQPSA